MSTWSLKRGRRECGRDHHGCPREGRLHIPGLHLPSESAVHSEHLVSNWGATGWHARVWKSPPSAGAQSESPSVPCSGHTLFPSHRVGPERFASQVAPRGKRHGLLKNWGEAHRSVHSRLPPVLRPLKKETCFGSAEPYSWPLGHCARALPLSWCSAVPKPMASGREGTRHYVLCIIHVNTVGPISIHDMHTEVEAESIGTSTSRVGFRGARWNAGCRRGPCAATSPAHLMQRTNQKPVMCSQGNGPSLHNLWSPLRPPGCGRHRADRLYLGQAFATKLVPQCLQLFCASEREICLIKVLGAQCHASHFPLSTSFRCSLLIRPRFECDHPTRQPETVFPAAGCWDLRLPLPKPTNLSRGLWLHNYWSGLGPHLSLRGGRFHPIRGVRGAEWDGFIRTRYLVPTWYTVTLG